jgi:hypothetical protein
MTPVRRAVLTGSSLPGGGGTMLAELRQAIASAVLAGVELDAIEDAIIRRAPVDEEQKSALWLYAEVLIERSAELIHENPDDG